MSEARAYDCELSCQHIHCWPPEQQRGDLSSTGQLRPLSPERAIDPAQRGVRWKERARYVLEQDICNELRSVLVWVQQHKIAEHPKLSAISADSLRLACSTLTLGNLAYARTVHLHHCQNRVILDSYNAYCGDHMIYVVACTSLQPAASTGQTLRLS